MRSGKSPLERVRTTAIAARYVCWRAAVCAFFALLFSQPSHALDLPTCPLNPTMEDCRRLSSEFLSITQALYDRLNACQGRYEPLPESIAPKNVRTTSCGKRVIVYPQCFDIDELLCKARTARDREYGKCHAKALAAAEKERQEKKAQREAELESKSGRTPLDAAKRALQVELTRTIGKISPSLQKLYRSGNIAEAMQTLQDSSLPFRERYEAVESITRNLQGFLPPGAASDLSKQLSELTRQQYGDAAESAIAAFVEAMQDIDANYTAYQQSVNQIESGLRQQWEQNSAGFKAKLQQRQQATDYKQQQELERPTRQRGVCKLYKCDAIECAWWQCTEAERAAWNACTASDRFSKNPNCP
jgi:hypothetical protein